MLALVVGLGNPGARYRGTRHNVGFDWVDRAGAALGARWKAAPRYQAEVAEWRVDDRTLWAIKPLTYMNHSGRAVAPIARAKGLEPGAILVVHDELDLPPGTARLKAGGGHGGHNGLRDLTEQLGSREFLRLRLGIGHPGDRSQVTPYVLSRPSPDERTAYEAAMDRALEALPDLAAGHWQRAVNHLHAPGG
ncbi:MAG: aminoacyl-tRNA hydrolase [Gemmatimonadetes bacterium]|nr:aminoacyl-tRNA hydrolase [Gemmatimonadota bacterium]NIX38773.1 aminoacyl-tRNA hydrolase [Gemmatimonadota bacterium]